ncbi:MAG: ABC transporter permease [Thermoplasmata archaeon]|nr:MAG: ABC transporter permease [Thermoplasmata archaeon]
MNPRRIGANLSVDLKEFVRNKAAVFWTVMFPILLILLFGFIFQGEDEVSYTLPVQDADGGFWSKNLTATLNETGLFEVHMVDPNADPEEYMEDNNANVLLIIPEGYSQGINDTLAARSTGQPVNDTVNVTVIYDPAVSSTPAKMQILESIIQGINKGINREILGAQDTLGMDTKTTVSEEFNFIDFFAPGIIGMSVMATSLFGAVTINTELRQKGILRKLATTPITRPEWLMSNVLYQLVMSVFSIVAILAIGYVVFGLRPQINLFLPLFVLLTVFSFSGVGMLITRFVKEAQSAEAAANAVMFPMMFLAGTFFPLEMMPDFLQHIAKVLPLFYVNEGLRDAMIDLNFEGAIFNAAVIGIFGIIVFILGIFVTSWEEE